MLSLIKSLRGHVFLYMILLVSFYSVANYFIIKLIVSPRHSQIERSLAQQETERFIQALLREGEALATIAHDWSAWNDSYDFVQRPNPEYITSNLSDMTLTDGGFNLLSFYRLDGSLVWSRLFDLETQKEIVIDKLPSSGLPPDHPLLHHPNVESVINGLMHTAYGPLLIASHPIVTSENEGPIVGTLMFGRFLTEQLMTKLEIQTKVRCRIIDLHAQNTLSRIPIKVFSLGPDTPFLFHESSNKIEVYSLLHSIQGTPEWLVEIQADRLITAHSKEILSYVLLSNIAMGFITLLLFLIIYRYQLRAATSTFRGLIDQSLPPRTKERREYPLLRSFNTNEFSKLGYDLRTMIGGFEQSKEQQKDIINKYTSSLRQLNTKLVEEIKERLQIEEDLHMTQENLEKQVEKRTEELQQTNATLQEEIEIRKEKENDLINHRKRLRALSSELMEAEDRERRQLASDLHDQVGQSLSAVKMYVDGLVASTSAPPLERLQLIASIVDETIQDIRTLTFELSPPILYELGLSAALDWLTEEFQQKYGITITHTCDECTNCNTPATLALIFRTIRELLINVVRHAAAESAEVQVRCTGKGVRLTVKDNGCGMKDPNQKDGENTNGGFGLFSIRERVINTGGTVVINSSKDTGTAIILTIPFKEVCAKPTRLRL
jgi:signal transduction histidine kinase